MESYLLGAERRFTRAEVAEQAEVTPETSRKLWSALGFPAGSDDAVEYTGLDVAAVRLFRDLTVFRSADPRVVAASARTLGQSMARLTEWQADLVTTEILARAARTEGDSAESLREATEFTLDAFEELQRYTWRRHLAAAVTRSLDGSAGADHIRTLAVGFADMVGYTRLTRHLHVDELSTLLEAFESTTAAAITDNGGWVIKNVGDEVMFAAETVLAAARIAVAVQESTMMVGGTPDLRVAIAYGPVLQRFGDLYGSTVNAAARLTGVARPGTILIDDAAAAELDGEPEFRTQNLRSVRVRDFDRLRPHVLLPTQP
ncbi:adenylate/guanylate cyclase domain-containing protein [Nocardia harenae]|uniref:adenylate/guanylate cyclase domain-containing protein n=1 Tax=Nocardia harenae TaxID=358707 RepID=UPI00082D8AB8|nr:adenylate/guanylate cyclase domain-containing protein [Nocardia harenae]